MHGDTHERPQSRNIIQANILYKSTVGHYRPVSYPDGPITTRYRFIKNAYWGFPKLKGLIIWNDNTKQHFVENRTSKEKQKINNNNKNEEVKQQKYRLWKLVGA